VNIHWKDWCWCWNSSTLAIWCEELTCWKSPWCRERVTLIYQMIGMEVGMTTMEDNLTVVVQALSHVWLFATPWTAAHQASLSFTISQSLFTLMSTESVMPSNHLILCHPFLLLSQHQGLFQQVSSSHQMAKVLEFQHQHQSFQWIFTVYFL